MSKVNPKPFLPFLFLVFVVVEPVEFAGAVRNIGLQFAGIFQQAHREEFLPEVAAVELDIQDGLIEVLQFTERELLGQKAEAQRMFLDPFLQPFVADIEDLPVVEGHIRKRGDPVPMQFIVKDLQFMMFDIYQ